MYLYYRSNSIFLRLYIFNHWLLSKFKKCCKWNITRFTSISQLPRDFSFSLIFYLYSTRWLHIYIPDPGHNVITKATLYIMISYFNFIFDHADIQPGSVRNSMVKNKHLWLAGAMFSLTSDKTEIIRRCKLRHGTMVTHWRYCDHSRTTPSCRQWRDFLCLAAWDKKTF